MLVTRKAEYGIRALMYLALREGDARPVSAKTVASAEGIPRVYLEQLFNRLKRKGLVKSARGPLGGYRLSARPEKISVLDIIEALDGGLNVRGSSCSRINENGSRAKAVAADLWQEVERDIRTCLDRISLREIVRKTAHKQTATTSPGDYGSFFSGV